MESSETNCVKATKKNGSLETVGEVSAVKSEESVECVEKNSETSENSTKQQNEITLEVKKNGQVQEIKESVANSDFREENNNNQVQNSAKDVIINTQDRTAHEKLFSVGSEDVNRNLMNVSSYSLPDDPVPPVKMKRKKKDKMLKRSNTTLSDVHVGGKMFSWLSKAPEIRPETYDNVIDGLKTIYKNKMLPLEQHYLFNEFHSPSLNDADFDAKPMILLVGQYSTGKTTFIKYLLERDFPGMRIGPEPTTDRFIAVMYSDTEGVIPGNALVVDPKKQFRPLSCFGNAFLNRFQCSLVDSSVLKGMTIIDTPGILSGEKQRIDRGYDFTGVLEWFAERVDRIILLFDAHKLDISDEFRRSIEALRGHDDKIRIVLNKADMIDHQQLMRVYGALMWSLGKVLQTPEVVRVYIGSFWDEPLRYDGNRKLFEDETQDLFTDLQSLPKNSALRKLNDLIKRARLAKVHAYIISELKKEMPRFGKETKKRELIKNLSQIYEKIQKEHQISIGDFPEISKMQEQLTKQDFGKFHSLKPKLLDVVNDMLSINISHLMSRIPFDSSSTSQPEVTGGAFENVEDKVTPFGYKSGEGINAGFGEPEWIVNKERQSYDTIFEALGPVDGKLSGATVKEELVKSKLPNAILGKIWKLSDVDRDGYLDKDEFALAMHLINVKLNGNEIPFDLPDHLVPPRKKEYASKSTSHSHQSPP
ncbi:EH domain-containing protein 1-like [Diabrotica virgifera virgifera]|uniref:EH domain-containing protein 1-like n=1 Tax=Diabrotica virgifera virgifera TaxID=50390 RepID=A0A6P7H0R9_DIAVI|nr:EH domain-containing protein 1-like [Diabrotica virgifera virgifera]XP_050503758.1 EH domain-containing protein 1-like [Diabrotica virgifera virgifera]